jgi:hypothetical protein
MTECQKKTIKCINCNDHFECLRPLVKEIIVTKIFLKEAPGFNVNSIIECEHAYFRELHKFEELIDGNYIFRALRDKTHIVYVIDRNHRLIFLRAFKNFKVYKRFLEDKKGILHLIEKG